jgi:hypothetical protein
MKYNGNIEQPPSTLQGYHIIQINETRLRNLHHISSYYIIQINDMRVTCFDSIFYFVLYS